MTTTISTEETAVAPIDALVRRACSLYTLPAVAAEVIQLTNNPKVDAAALKECIQTDPALTAKLLRVVNSSLFGLSREVCDLNQALALLGTKPLKLLVLGFSLPENLFAKVARKQLNWYWSTTLTRAVAAREISERLFDCPGDDAFLAGLFQDIGVLVLLGELKEPYAEFLSGVIEQRVDLRQLEVDSLGFDHLQFTAALLEHWNMPVSLVRAIAEPRDHKQLATSTESHAKLAQAVHLAELVAELVGQNRLDVLPDIMEVGAAYCDLDKESLTTLVVELQPKILQLAEVLSLDVVDEAENDYVDILVEANRQMSELTEEVVGLLGRRQLEQEEAYCNLLADATRLRSTIDSFLHHTTPPEGTFAAESPAQSPRAAETPTNQPPVECPVELSNATGEVSADFVKQLTFAVGHCRSRRLPLSLLIIELGGDSSRDTRRRPMLGQILTVATRPIELPDMICESPIPCRRVLVLPGCDRHDAVRLGEQTIERIDRIIGNLKAKGTVLKHETSIGVSSVGLPPKNFLPQDLLDTAERCLSGAQSSGASVVKSLEIY